MTKTNHFIGLFTLMMITLMCHNSFATIIPRSLSSDARIKVVAFSDNNIVPIEASTFTTTQIIFGEEEYIQNIQNGDLPAWTANVQKQLPNMVFIKPTVEGSNTNMTIVTNKHTYYFALKSLKKGNQAKAGNLIYAIRFIYPQEEAARLTNEMAFKKQNITQLNQAKTPLDYNWDYSFNGAKQIVPIHMFDDGQFTYMQLKPNQTIPAVFAVDNPEGKESVVNYRREGQYLVIHQVAPQYTLRYGRQIVASIFNNTLIADLLHNKA